MNRKVKNVVMITTLLIVCILNYFTMSGAVKSTIPNNSTFGKEFEGTPPNFNNGQFSEEDMPQRPSSNFQDGEMPNLENLPENFGNGEIPDLGELPENFNKDAMPENFEENFKNGNFSKQEFKANISTIYYILFAVEGLIISFLLIYLIMSKFNSKTLKETLDTGNKIIIFTILTIVFTIGLTVVDSMLAKNLFTTKNMVQFENREKSNNNNSNITNETTDKENNNEINQI